MSVRPFDWRDIPKLFRYRKQSVYLNAPVAYTWSPNVLASALISTFGTARAVFTASGWQDDENKQKLIGQAGLTDREHQAYLNFITPGSLTNTAAFSELIDYLSQEMGKQGSFWVTADIEGDSAEFDTLREAGFGIYTRQTVWRIASPERGQECSRWSKIRDGNRENARNLYNKIVPGMVQQVEPFNTNPERGLVLIEEGDTLGYAEVEIGPKGAWGRIIFHPDTRELGEYLKELAFQLSLGRTKPVYLCVRAYQSWIENSLDAIGAEQLSSQAVMVRHLAAREKVPVKRKVPTLNGKQPEITTPIEKWRNTNTA